MQQIKGTVRDISGDPFERYGIQSYRVLSGSGGRNGTRMVPRSLLDGPFSAFEQQLSDVWERFMC